MKEDINALDETHKGAVMGIEAIDFIIDKVKDKKFKEVLEIERSKYEKIIEKIIEIYPKYNDGQPQDISTMSKMMTWYGIEMKTFLDKSDSKIAELLINGTSMGIIEGKKITNNKNINKEVSRIITTFIGMQEDSIETLKKYL